MSSKPKDPFDCFMYFEMSVPELLPWYETRSWRLSREWLQAHEELITAAAVDNLLKIAGSVSATEKPAIAEELALHAQLLEKSLKQGVDVAYRELIGTDDLRPAEGVDRAELMRLTREWMNAPDWGTSRAYLGVHPAIISDESVALMQMALHTLTDEEGRAIVRDHLEILRLVREYGIFNGYQQFMLAHWGQ